MAWIALTALASLAVSVVAVVAVLVYRNRPRDVSNLREDGWMELGGAPDLEESLMEKEGIEPQLEKRENSSLQSLEAQPGNEEHARKG